MKEYRLTTDQLQELCRDFQADCHDGFVSNDKAYIESWLQRNGNTPKMYNCRCKICHQEFQSTDPDFMICPTCYA